MIGILRKTPAAPRERALPDRPPTRQAVLEQVERIIASPLFRNSKRYSGLLKYAVEQKLENRTDLLKERLLGIEVFGREADYDTNHDPVVRTSAVEIRKRLAQFYEDPAHSGEIRITLAPGSYTPEFSAGEAPPAPPPDIAKATRPGHWRRLLWISIGAVAASAAALALVAEFSRSAVDAFWRPVYDSPAPVLFAVSGGPRQTAGSTGAGPAQTLADMFQTREDYVPFGDVGALVDLGGYMRARNKPYRLRYLSTIAFQDLKAGPAVLIGPTTRWFDQLATGVRFSVERDEGVTRTWISDRQSPSSRAWSADVNASSNSTEDTFALITRIRLESTRQILVSIAGLSPYATSAAGELLSEPQYLNEFARHASAGWYDRNLQLVVATKRVGTTPGTPKIVAQYVW
jgi:hypothetical protein